MTTSAVASPVVPRPPLRRRRPPALRRDLRLVFVEVMGWAVMVGWGEQNLTPLALALGVRESLSGLVHTVPFLLGAALQLGVPALVRRSGTLRPVVVGLAALQALALLALAAAALRGAVWLPLLLGILVLYWGAGLGTGPPWMTWMDTLLPRPVRARFFARRTVLARLTMGASLLGAGWVLERATAAGARLGGFAVLMAVAAAARVASAALLAKQSDVPATPDEVRDVPLGVLFSRKVVRRDGRLVLFLLAFVGAGAIAMPLLPAFLLEQRKVGYMAWSVLAAAPFLARLVALPFIGSVAARRGPEVVLAWGVTLACAVPAAWVLCPDHLGAYLVLAFLAGAIESAHVLGSFLLVFEAVRREERCSIMASYNLAVGLSLTLGAGIGGGLLRFLGEGADAYTAVFLLAGAGQALSLVLLRRFLRG